MSVNCTKLSCFTHKIFVLFANVWHAERSWETCLLRVSINKAPSQVIIIYVCLCVCHAWTTLFFPAIWFQFSLNGENISPE